MAWQFSATATAGQQQPLLPATPRVGTDDVLRLVILHGNEQSLDYIGGIDLFSEPPDTIRWTDLPVPQKASVSWF